MKIEVKHLKEQQMIPITGAEPWLATLYGDFRREGLAAPQLRGEVELRLKAGDRVHIRAQLDFNGGLDCSRCLKALDWRPGSLDLELELKPAVDLPLDAELRYSDLDMYYYEAGIIDLEALINEHIQLARPEVYLRRDQAKPESCGICQRDLSQSLVASSAEAGATDQAEGGWKAALTKAKNQLAQT